MTTRARNSAAVAALGIVLALVGAVLTPAHADTGAWPDRTGDVRRTTFDGSGDTTTQTTSLVPKRKQGDLRSYRVSYAPERIRMTLGFRDLRRKAGHVWVVAGLRWGGDRFDEVTLETGPGNRRGRSLLESDPTCAVQHRVDYGRNRMTIVLPARCLERPDRLRFRVSVHETDDREDPSYFFKDTAPGAGKRWSPHVDRG
ncbi:hypothetical protein [Nocardioides sp. cx-173]|uniref:hypothetical protein n=1 Tax=Nocardioides sp. cx-173 TaxID=2898796 RepID=UPI001E49C123|nr:hypothetical protein [Nocardioides sp. cx-173]MCD4526800.1 hypothetical protein [Nocardioides sp. cx-173]UGB43903.1 hypothetical protein LQ940_10385 [Nocardioides sp. cx-173]